MSQHATELCTILVNEVYGELSSRVFSVLMRYGRLALQPLIHHSQLPVRQIKHGLAVLIQQHLVRHYTGYDDNVTYYEADWKAAYALVRSGKLIMLAEEKFGRAAGDLVSNLLLQGHTSTKDLAKAYLAAAEAVQNEADVAKATTKDGGHGKDPCPCDDTRTSSVLDQLDTTLRNLLDNGLVCLVKADDFRPPADTYNEAVRAVKRSGISNGTKGSKANLRFELEVRNQLKRWRDEGNNKQRRPQAFQGLKRRLEDMDAEHASKRTKIDSYYGATTNGQVATLMNHQTLSPLDESLVVRVNFDKYTVLSRNQRLAELAERKIDKSSAAVYAALLDKLAHRIPRCQDDLAEEQDAEEYLRSNPSTSTIELASDLPPTIGLASALGKSHGISLDGKRPKARAAKAKRWHADKGLDKDKANVRANITEVIQDMDDAWWDQGYGETDVPLGPNISKRRINEVKLHLKVLAQEPHSFVHLIENREQGKWTIDIRRLLDKLKQVELEDIITNRFGIVALRLIRVLSDKGKLDEKQISNFALVRQKDIRSTLTAMHQAGYLELQEVPRDNSRQPSRTMFLWFFDPDRCRQMVIEDTYKAMARFLQRAATERDAIRHLLDKAERTDVVGHEDVYLTREERRALQVWRDKEERLLAQIMMLDRQVELFRDF